METVFPSTTWPTHVSMVTGVSPRAHGVVANHILNRGTRAAEDLTGDPIYDAPALLRAPTVYDLAHAAGLRTAAVDWPATRNADHARLQPALLQGPARVRDPDRAGGVGGAGRARLPDAPAGRVGAPAEALPEGRDGRPGGAPRGAPSRTRPAAPALPLRGQPAASPRPPIARGLLGARVRGRPDRPLPRLAPRPRPRPDHRVRGVRPRLPAVASRDPPQREAAHAGGGARGALRDESRRGRALPARRRPRRRAPARPGDRGHGGRERHVARRGVRRPRACPRPASTPRWPT